MNLDSMSFFDLASKRMQWLSARQRVVAENIANADTPEYKARDVNSFEEMLAAAGDGPASDGEVPGLRISTDETAWESSMDGNTVGLEQQSLLAADNAENYRLAANLYRKGYDLLTLSVTGTR